MTDSLMTSKESLSVFLKKNIDIAEYRLFNGGFFYDLSNMKEHGFDNVKSLFIRKEDYSEEKCMEFLKYLHLFENLKELSLHGIDAEYIEFPRNLTTIESLMLFEMKNMNQYPGNLGDMINLKKMHISGCPVNHLPLFMTSIESLHMIGTKMTTISDDISELTNLKYLTLNQSQTL